MLFCSDFTAAEVFHTTKESIIICFSNFPHRIPVPLPHYYSPWRYDRSLFKCNKKFAVLFSFPFLPCPPINLWLCCYRVVQHLVLWSSLPKFHQPLQAAFGHEGAHQGFIGEYGQSVMPEEPVVGEGNLL